jgi:NADPH:quinone reductase-like Zn-dependent oxidoreductase
MKAVLFTGKGGPEVIEWRETTDPAPARGEVLVRVRAAAHQRTTIGELIEQLVEAYL